jgi:hypothetical protein
VGRLVVDETGIFFDVTINGIEEIWCSRMDEDIRIVYTDINFQHNRNAGPDKMGKEQKKYRV